ncbi:glycosyltransferase family 2 protein [Carnobacteriaceae bacterium zg-ZUI252]|nr:glycosyltransferase family 2 protein [Carnobacteriaceae bacterium zg-ZUI252]MBS4769586.1 glycosyltransferase family 2 protein [Carnobacteriaceae bacterium zg-ZUI240]QTU83049.1 glycosyltransferase family 2 protein [Carnobacteriaceae bacterium zg-C25]
MKLSVIIPCFNEQKVIEQTYQVLSNEMKKLPIDAYELIFVNDGSGDKTLESIKSFAQHDARVKYISFSRNFGKESAMLAGLKACRGDVAVIMDADLQHPPMLIKDMLKKYDEGYDQVIATRTRTGDSAPKTFFSKWYYRLVNRLTDVEMKDGAGDFRLLSSRVIQSLVDLPEYNRFSKGLFSWVGYNKYYLPYENVERAAGASKFSLKSLLNYGVQGILSFNDKPLRMCVKLGLFILSLCIVYIVAMVVEFFTKGVSSNGYFTTMTAILLIGGVQLLSIGVLGEYIGKIYYEVKKRPHYIIEESNVDKS